MQRLEVALRCVVSEGGVQCTLDAVQRHLLVSEPLPGGSGRGREGVADQPHSTAR
jgi:hypothetical protein